MRRKDFFRKVGLGAFGSMTGIVSGQCIRSKESAPENDSVSIPRRKLGKNGLMASVLCLGAGSRFTNEQFLQPAEREKYIVYALDAGVNYIDTAINYGASEQILGSLLGGREWEKIILSTKTNSRTYDSILRDFETSRRNLKSDFFDVYLLHNGALSPDVESNREAFETLQSLKGEGLVGNIGFSCHGAVSPAMALELVENYNLDHLVLSVYENMADYRHIIPQLHNLGCTASAIKITLRYEGEGPVSSARDSYRDILEKHFSSGIISHSNAGIGPGGWQKVLDMNLATARSYG